jgi:hypothetical protein
LAADWPKSRNQPTRSGENGRRKSITGWPSRIAVIARRKVGLAICWSFGRFCTASVASLNSPGCEMILSNCWNTGVASFSSGRSSWKNLGRSSAATLDACSSGSRSSSVARRSTNVELPLRSVSGSTASPSDSEAFSLAIAPIIPLRFVTSEVSCGARSATALVTPAPATIACSSVRWSRVSSLTSCEVVDSVGLNHLADSLTSSPLPAYCTAEPWMTF